MTRRSRSRTASKQVLVHPLAFLCSLLLGAVVLVPMSDLARAADGRTLYVSPTGDDAATGLTPATAWRTIDRANSELLRPGDRLLFAGGARFTGGLILDAAEAGNPDEPVVIGSYGAGRATLAATAQTGILIYNTAGVEIRDLVLTGDDGSFGRYGGVSFYRDERSGPGRASDGRLAHAVVSNVDISGFKNGVDIGGIQPGKGFADVLITDSLLHNNRDAGLYIYGPAFDAAKPTYAHAGVRVVGVTARENLGDRTNTVSHTGSGIILGSVDGGLIEWSSATANGSECAAPEGPVGLWAYDSHKVVIQHNVSYLNRTGGTADGDGFDLDQNVSESVLQYNLSYGNAGAGYLVFTAQDNGALRDNVVRFNISDGDARGSGWYGGITVSGRMTGVSIYHNTVITRPAGTHQPAALTLGTGLDGVEIQNNILLARHGGPVVRSPEYDPSTVLFQGNGYAHRTGEEYLVRWADRGFDSLRSWQDASRQETRDGDRTGLEGDPGLRAPDVQTALTDPRLLARTTQYALKAAAPAAGRGLDFGTDIGDVDYFGATLGKDRPASIGVFQPAQVPDRSDPPAGSMRRYGVPLLAVALLVLAISVLVGHLWLRRRAALPAEPDLPPDAEFAPPAEYAPSVVFPPTAGRVPVDEFVPTAVFPPTAGRVPVDEFVPTAVFPPTAEYRAAVSEDEVIEAEFVHGEVIDTEIIDAELVEDEPLHTRARRR